MRSRTEIEEDEAADGKSFNGPTALVQRLILEVLLDIRDILATRGA